jgi:hypothetical protein
VLRPTIGGLRRGKTRKIDLQGQLQCADGSADGGKICRLVDQASRESRPGVRHRWIFPGPHGVNSLIIGYDGDKLMYVARTRNGFVPAPRRQVFSRLKHLVTSACSIWRRSTGTREGRRAHNLCKTWSVGESFNIAVQPMTSTHGSLAGRIQSLTGFHYRFFRGGDAQRPPYNSTFTKF